MALTTFHYFGFHPSEPAALVALSLILAAALAVLFVTIWTKSWFMLLATAVGVLEVAGYCFRVAMLSHPQRGFYIAMECLLIIPPSFLAIINYIVLGRLITCLQTGPPSSHAMLLSSSSSITSSQDSTAEPPRSSESWLALPFLALEVTSLLCQGIGERLP